MQNRRQVSEREVDAFADGVVRKLERIEDSCALDVADRGPTTLREIAALLDVTREAVRQIAEGALRSARRAGVTIAPEVRELLEQLDAMDLRSGLEVAAEEHEGLVVGDVSALHQALDRELRRQRGSGRSYGMLRYERGANGKKKDT